MVDRREVLKKYGAEGGILEELGSYGESGFSTEKISWPVSLPLPDEAHVAAWEDYLSISKKDGAFACLQERLPQFWFPIAEGTAQNDLYRAATLRGEEEYRTKITEKLTMNSPEKVGIFCYQTLAGRIPIITAGDRQDFVSLLQAIFKKGEPEPVPDAVGATMGAGFNNWDRIRQYKERWVADNSILFWGEEFKKLIARKELYQDKFILISGGLYSNVSAEEVGLAQDEWQELSLKIRMEHESTHYMTARFFGSVRDCAFEEMVADYTGIVEAVGEFRADWFLRFMGLEDFPRFRETGRLIRYRGNPALSDRAFEILQKMIVDAAHHIEELDRKFFKKGKRGSREKALMFFALSEGCLEEWASGQLEGRVQDWDQKLDSMITVS